ncbi:MAG: LysR family transcriptional regulator [Myxococcota bacterium]
MQTFVRVVEAGSFSAVAREMGSTQGAVSKQVAGLEKALGHRLLSRTTRALALTPEGLRYFEQVRRIVAEVAEAESTLRTGEAQLSGWLRVAASVAFGRLKLFPILQSFLDAHPDVRIDVKLSDGFVDLVEHGIDVAIRIGQLADSTLIARRIGNSNRLLVAHRDYLRKPPKGVCPPMAPDDLTSHQCIVYTSVPHANEWTFKAGPRSAVPIGTMCSVRVAGSIQTNSSEVIRAAVLSGMGIGYSPSWLFEKELASGELEILLPEWTAPPVPIHLVSPVGRSRSTKVKAFSDHVVSQLK